MMETPEIVKHIQFLMLLGLPCKVRINQDVTLTMLRKMRDAYHDEEGRALSWNWMGRSARGLEGKVSCVKYAVEGAFIIEARFRHRWGRSFTWEKTIYLLPSMISLVEEPPHA